MRAVKFEVLWTRIRSKVPQSCQPFGWKAKTSTRHVRHPRSFSSARFSLTRCVACNIRSIVPIALLRKVEVPYECPVDTYCHMERYRSRRRRSSDLPTVPTGTYRCYQKSLLLFRFTPFNFSGFSLVSKMKIEFYVPVRKFYRCSLRVLLTSQYGSTVPREYRRERFKPTVL